MRSQQLLATGDMPVVIASGTGTMPSQDAPYPSLQVVKAGLEMLSLQYPQAKQTDASLNIEPTFMKRIDDSGFVRALYKN